MDQAQLSRFPHLSWFPFPVEGSATNKPCVLNIHGVCHRISLTLTGSCVVRWIVRGREVRWSEQPGTLHILPADGERHTFIWTAPPDLRQATVLIPKAHVTFQAESDRVRGPHEFQRLMLTDDALAGRCVTALGASTKCGDARLDVRSDEIARQLLLRLCELYGTASPDWDDDANLFPRPTLNHLVAHIDEHLCDAPSNAELAVLAGVSPSHLARKFQRSTGLSVQRFINRRRVRRSLDLLRTTASSLAHVAASLGFSSQSHFSRVFSGLTGVTPAKYRRLFRPAVG